MDVPSTASTYTLTLPAATGTVLQTGTTVTVAQGGTGLATLTANNVVLGNGTGTPNFVAPGTSGNVLTSNGTTWASTAIPATSPITLGTAVSPSGVTSVLYNTIPSGVKRIIVSTYGLTTSGSAYIQVQMGPSGGLTTSGYIGYVGLVGTSNVYSHFSSAFLINPGASSGMMILTLLDSATNTWSALGNFGFTSSNNVITSSGAVPLSGSLTQLSINTANGTDTFTAGKVNIMYES